MHPAVKPLLATIAFAMLAGWSVHRDSPQGLLRATDQGCMSVSHGFTSMYVVVLGVAGAVALAVAITAYIASELGLFGTRRDGLRQLARTCTLFTGGLVVASLLSWPIEGMLPLQAPPKTACMTR